MVIIRIWVWSKYLAPTRDLLIMYIWKLSALLILGLLSLLALDSPRAYRIMHALEVKRAKQKMAD